VPSYPAESDVVYTAKLRDGAESLGFAGGAPDGGNTARRLGKYVFIFNNIDMKRAEDRLLHRRTQPAPPPF